MLLGFKRRFAPFVKDKSKFHTIRDPRTDRPFCVGDRLDCYMDPRQKTMALLGRHPCVRIAPIELYLVGPFTPHLLGIRIEGETLKRDEAERFAWLDGFRDPGRSSLQQLIDYWLEEGRAFPWTGEVRYWDPNIDVPFKKAKARAHAAR